jgi:hypothetical protein
LQELIEVQDDYLESAEDQVVLKMKRADFLDNPEAKASWGDSKPVLIQHSKVIKQEIKRDPDGDNESIPVVNLDFSETTTISSIITGSNEEIFLLQVYQIAIS